jgi:hypothetical protein
MGPRPISRAAATPAQDTSGQIQDQSLEQAGQALGQSAEQMFAERTNLARAKAANAHIDYEVAVKQATVDLAEKVQTGEVPYSQAKQQWQQTVAGIELPKIDYLDPVGQEHLKKGTQRIAYQQGVVMDKVVGVAQRDDFKDQFADNLDKLGKLAGLPGADIEDINQKADAFRPLARAAGIPEHIVDKHIQDFKDQNWLNDATQRSMEAKDSMPALNTLEHDLTAQDGYYAGKLDTDKRNIVLRSVINDRLILQNRIEHEQDKREAKAQSTLGRIDEQIASGIPATPQMWTQWEGLTKGTSVEDEFKQRVDDENKVQGVLREPVDQQVRYVQEQAQKLQSDGGTLRDHANLMRLQTAVNQNVNLMEKAPLLFAANRNGTEVAPLNLQGMDTPDGKDQVTAAIHDRMATLGALRKQYGSAIAPTPLLPQEAAQLSAQLDSSTPAAKAQMLVSLRGAFNDDTAYQAAMRQIAPRSPVTAIAGQMVGSSSPASTPVWFDHQFAPDMTTPQRILTGEALLNPTRGEQAGEEGGKGTIKTGMPMPPDGGIAGLRAEFGKAAGDLFRDRPQLADAHYAVFKAAYAALLAEKGDMKGVGDPTLEKQALQMSLGTRTKFNGDTVSVPVGMDPTRFSGLVQNAVAGAAHRANAPADWADRIRGYQLRELGSVGSGQYELVNGNAPLIRPDGKGPFIIDLKNQYLATNGARGSPEDIQRGQ